MTTASTDGGPWFYPDVVSVRPGGRVTIHASGTTGTCHLVVRRLGAEAIEVARFDGIEVGSHPIPERADAEGCDWPATFSFEVGPDWASGYHDLELVDGHGGSTRHFVVVRPAEGATPAPILLVLATNTYQSYNYWGGANSYADVDAIMAREIPPTARDTGIGRLSRLRPYAQKLIAPPPGAPRLVNLRLRAPGVLERPGDRTWSAEHRPTPYDGAAGYVDKWEHAFVAWAEREGLVVDVATDHDLDIDDDLLDRYRCVALVGHSEYWSGGQRRRLDRYVTNGGHLAIFSGNTGYWKVRWEDDGDTLIAHKWAGETADPLWADPATRPDATHLWSHPEFARPEAEVTGLSFLYGGYHRLMMCVARGAGGHTVYDDEHWALDGVDLFYGDTFGTEVPLLGYENDGCPIRFDDRGLPVPDGGVGVPQDFRILGFAPAMLFEPSSSPFPPAIPPENPEVLAEIAHGVGGEAGVARVNRGHAVIGSFTKGAGEVFNAGTTEWAHGLAADDPHVVGITRNVLRRFTDAQPSNPR